MFGFCFELIAEILEMEPKQYMKSDVPNMKIDELKVIRVGNQAIISSAEPLDTCATIPSISIARALNTYVEQESEVRT